MEIAEVKLKSNKRISSVVMLCNEGANKPVCQSLDVRSYPIVVAFYKGDFIQMPTRRGPAQAIVDFCTTACATLLG